MQLYQLNMEHRNILAIFVCHKLMDAAEGGEDKLPSLTTIMMRVTDLCLRMR